LFSTRITSLIDLILEFFLAFTNLLIDHLVCIEFCKE